MDRDRLQADRADGALIRLQRTRGGLTHAAVDRRERSIAPEPDTCRRFFES